MDRFNACLTFVLKWEGGFSDDPQDHGGATNLGVIQTEYDKFRAGGGFPLRSVRFITRDEASQIYRKNYWQRLSLDGVGAPMDLIRLDTAINMGVGEEATINGRHPGNGVVLDKARNYLADRDNVYHKIAAKPGQSKFLQGWLNRTADLRKALGL